MNTRAPLHLAAVFAVGLTTLANAADPAVFNSQPATVREMSTDRPDQTEGAFTVPKGMFQFEFGFLNYSRRLDTDHRTENFTWGEVNAKYGLTNDLDFQLLWQPWTEQRFKGNPDQGEDGYFREGVNDLNVRLKWNLIGNDSGPFALALLPSIKVPTAKHRIGNDLWEGGLAIATEIDLGGGWSLGNTITGYVAGDSDDTLYFRPSATAVLGYDITEKLSCFVEIFAANQMDTERFWQTSLDAGIGYAITENMIFDAGAFWFFRGDEAINPFVGLSVRF
jgi:opacity protein-like surface antigen